MRAPVTIYSYRNSGKVEPTSDKRQMRYTVARGGMRLLGRAVHSLAKIGDDIYIEPQADSLTLRAVNSSRYVHD